MIDVRLLRENPDLVRKDLERRGMAERLAEVDEALELDKAFRALQVEGDELRHRRNLVSQEINARKKKGEDVSSWLEEAKQLPDKIKENEAEQEEAGKKLDSLLMRLPNVLHESVPKGDTEEDNVLVREWGEKPSFSFKPKDHVDLMADLGIADIPKAAEVSGARFYYLKGGLALMEQALLMLGANMLLEKGFTLVSPPTMMRREPYEGVTDLKDFEEMMYKVEGEDLYLIATSEHPIAAMHWNETLEEDALPLKYVGVSRCFRSEAGAHGKDTKGVFRVHEFNKVEQLVFAKPEDSWAIHEELIKNTEELFQKLGIPYRVMNICTGEIGTVAAKKYDLETWMPAQNCYREVVSCSNCTSYQATRLKVRLKRRGKNEEKDWVHTLNSTMVATPRTLVSILENFQQEDGSIKVPEALQTYMNGLKEITPTA